MNIKFYITLTLLIGYMTTLSQSFVIRRVLEKEESYSDTIVVNEKWKVYGDFEISNFQNIPLVLGSIDVVKFDSIIVLSLGEFESYTIEYNINSLTIVEYLSYYDINTTEYSHFSPYRIFNFCITDSCEYDCEIKYVYGGPNLDSPELKNFINKFHLDVRNNKFLKHETWNIDYINKLFYASMSEDSISTRHFKNLTIFPNLKPLLELDEKNPTELQIEYDRLLKLFNHRETSLKI